MGRRVAAMVVALVGLASFALPFFVASYQGEAVLQFTGIELLQGTTFHHRIEYGNEAVLPPALAVVPVAWLAFLAILISGIALFREGRRRNLVGRAAALAGIIASVALRSQGQAAVARIMPPALGVAPLAMLWTPLAAAFVLWALSVLAPKTKAPAEAGALLKL